MKFTLADMEDLYEAQALLLLAYQWVGRSIATQEDAEAVGHLRAKIHTYIERVEGRHASEC
jgi:hypothetical protein